MASYYIYMHNMYSCRVIIGLWSSFFIDCLVRKKTRSRKFRQLIFVQLSSYFPCDSKSTLSTLNIKCVLLLTVRSGLFSKGNQELFVVIHFLGRLARFSLFFLFYYSVASIYSSCVLKRYYIFEYFKD